MEKKQKKHDLQEGDREESDGREGRGVQWDKRGEKNM